jgi:hypothetical protein
MPMRESPWLGRSLRDFQGDPLCQASEVRRQVRRHGVRDCPALVAIWTLVDLS